MAAVLGNRWVASWLVLREMFILESPPRSPQFLGMRLEVDAMGCHHFPSPRSNEVVHDGTPKNGVPGIGMQRMPTMDPTIIHGERFRRSARKTTLAKPAAEKAHLAVPRTNE